MDNRPIIEKLQDIINSERDYLTLSYSEIDALYKAINILRQDVLIIGEEYNSNEYRIITEQDSSGNQRFVVKRRR